MLLKRCIFGFTSLILFFCLWAIQPLNAQGNLRFQDAETDAPLEMVRVVIRSLKNETSRILYSDASGAIPMPDTTFYPFFIQFSLIGYATLTDTISIPGNYSFALRSVNSSLDPIVVTGQFTPVQASKAVMKVQTISRDKMDDMGANSLADVMRFQNSLVLSQDMVLGTGMQMQGMGGEHVKILIDGVPVTGRQNGNVDFQQLPLDDIETIEIVQGALGIQYGNNAMAGTINLIRKKQVQPALTTRLYTDATGVFRNHFRLNFGTGKMNWSLYLLRHYFDGWHPDDKAFPDFRRRVADTSRFDLWKPRLQHAYGFAWSIKIQRLKVDLRSDRIDDRIDNRGMPRQPYGLNAFDDRYFTQRWDQNIHLTWNRGASVWQSQNALNYFTRTKNTWLTDLTNLEKRLTLNPGDQDTTRNHLYMSRTVWLYKPDSSRWTLESGYDIQHEMLTGDRILNERQDITDAAIFATIDWIPLSGLTLKPGFRWAYNSAFHSPMIPSLAMRYELNKFVFRSSIARGFRAPSVKELYFLFVDINHNIQGNPDLLPENSVNTMASVDYHVSKNITLDVNVNYNQIQNRILLINAGNTLFQYRNSGDWEVAGARTGISVNKNRHTLQCISSFWSLISRLPETPTQWFPSTDVNINYSLQFPKYAGGISIFYKYQGRQNAFYLNDAGEREPLFMAAFQMADFSAHKHLLDKSVKIQLGVRNAFNVIQVASSIQGGAHSSGSGSNMIANGRFVFMNIEWNLKIKK
jgi:outer membrane receptor for ferrienterochelin and colicins